MDPADLLVLGALAGAMSLLARRGATGAGTEVAGPRRPGAVVASAGGAVGRLAARTTAGSGRAVATSAGWAVGTGISAAAYGSGLAFDVAVAALDTAGRAVTALTSRPAPRRGPQGAPMAPAGR